MQFSIHLSLSLDRLVTFSFRLSTLKSVQRSGVPTGTFSCSIRRANLVAQPLDRHVLVSSVFCSHATVSGLRRLLTPPIHDAGQFPAPSQSVSTSHQIYFANMTEYFSGHRMDAAHAAAAAAANEASAMHPQYHPQEAMLNDNRYAVMPDPRDFFAAQGGGYYPPPQAPRLTAAAACASHFAAMYYDPTLHPQHAYSSNVPAPAPWAAPYYTDMYGGGGGGVVFNNGPPAPEYVPASTVQHQQVEQDLIRRNQLSRLSHPSHRDDKRSNRYPSHDSNVSANGPSNLNPRQPGFVPSSNGFSTQGMHDKTWAPHYDEQYHPQSRPIHAITLPSTPSEYVPASQPGTLFQGAPFAAHAAPGPHHNAGLGDQMWSQDASRRALHHRQWDGAQQLHGQRSLSQDVRPSASWPWNNSHRQRHSNGGWPPEGEPTHYATEVSRGGTCLPGSTVSTEQWQDPHQRQVRAETDWQPYQQQYMPEQKYPAQMANARGVDMGAGAQHEWNNHHQPNVPAIHAPTQPQYQAHQPGPIGGEGQGQGHQWPVPAQNEMQQKQPTAPAPPSPGTLDKSAVPVSAQGAEIVWIAAAAMLDPSLLRSFFRQSNSAARSQDAGQLSSDSSPAVSPSVPATSKWSQRSADGACLHNNDCAADLMEDSSASSSEPSTPPPATMPSRLHDTKGNRINGPKSPTSPMDVCANAGRPRPFYRSASHDRAKEAVSSIASLMCTEWKWSLNDDKLASLPHAGQRVDSGAQEHSSVSRHAHSPRSATASANPVGIPISGTDPSPAFRRFAHQVLAQTLVSPTAFMLGLMYALRVLQLAVITDESQDARLDPEAVEIFAQPPSAAPFKLFTLGLMVANKHLDDNTFLNKTWNEVTGISLPELNRMERWYLEKCSYEITVPMSTWTSFLESLKRRNESQINALQEKRRAQVRLHALPDAGRSASQSDGNAPAGGDRNHTMTMRPQRSGSNDVSSGHPTMAATEDSLKRFLTDTEEALQAIGRLPPFDLAGLNTW